MILKLTISHGKLYANFEKLIFFSEDKRKVTDYKNSYNRYKQNFSNSFQDYGHIFEIYIF